MQQQLLQPFDVLLVKSLEADKNLAPAARLESLKDKRMMAIQFFEQKIRDVEFEMGVPPAHAAGAEYVVSSNVCLAELGHALSKGRRAQQRRRSAAASRRCRCVRCRATRTVARPTDCPAASNAQVSLCSCPVCRTTGNMDKTGTRRTVHYSQLPPLPA